MADTQTQHAKPARAKAGDPKPAGSAGSDQVKRVLPALVVDAEALGRAGSFEARIHWLADWIEAREWCRCPLDLQRHSPFCEPPDRVWIPELDAELRHVGGRWELRNLRRERQADYRQTFPEDPHRDRQDPHSSLWDERRGALDRVHRLCDESEKWLFASKLSSQRPGAREPWEDCTGCCFSYLGELESDRSIVAAYTPHAPGATVGLDRMPHQDIPVRYVDVVEKRREESEKRRLLLERSRRFRASMPTPGKAEPQQSKEPKAKRKGARR